MCVDEQITKAISAHPITYDERVAWAKKYMALDPNKERFLRLAPQAQRALVIIDEQAALGGLRRIGYKNWLAESEAHMAKKPWGVFPRVKITKGRPGGKKRPT